MTMVLLLKSVAEVQKLWETNDPRKNKGPLQKGGPFSVFAGLQDSTESGDSLRWLPPSLAGNGLPTNSIGQTVVLCKSHNKGYTKQNGAYVAPFDDKRVVKPHKLHAPHLGLGKPSHPPKSSNGGYGDLFGGAWFGSGSKAPASQPPKVYPNAKPHPDKDHKGQTVIIKEPSAASAPETWDDPKAVAVFVPGGDAPAGLHGVPFAPWTDHPTRDEDWDYVDGVLDDMDEPPLELPLGKKAASGCVIEEPDGRIWLVSPTNAYCNYETTYPKGKAEDDLSLQANAIKEAFEEVGLRVEITGFLLDTPRSTSLTRYYTARRVGGNPAKMGWESQAVHLVPPSRLYDFLNSPYDYSLAEALGVGKKG